MSCIKGPYLVFHYLYNNNNLETFVSAGYEIWHRNVRKMVICERMERSFSNDALLFSRVFCVEWDLYLIYKLSLPR
jgi:hypothetical protein